MLKCYELSNDFDLSIFYQYIYADILIIYTYRKQAFNQEMNIIIYWLLSLVWMLDFIILEHFMN